jgi:hypothetical protein
MADGSHVKQQYAAAKRRSIGFAPRALHIHSLAQLFMHPMDERMKTIGHKSVSRCFIAP